jgi:predicted AAA+ superfamily ATPase
MADKEQIKEYIRDQIAQADFRAQGYVFDEQNKKRLNRNIFVRLQSHLNKFLEGNSAFRWAALTGLRGAGKTTVMYQLYYAKKNIDAYFLILSVDEIVGTLGSSISEILSVFEEVVGKPLSNLDKPLLLFLDEVQYDEKWGITLKTLYDKTNKVSIFATGSAAALVNSNSDIARRAIFEKMYPLSFSEFIKIKYQKTETRGLAGDIRDDIFSSLSAKEVYEKLLSRQARIDKYYFDISRLEFENYLNYGSLPFMIALDNEAIVYNQINKSLERVINKDIPQMRTMSQDIINKIPAILYAVADMDALNFTTLASKFKISRQKVAEIFSALEQSEVLHRIYPLGSHLNQVINTKKKPSKYLFSSPAFRAMYYKTIGNTITEENARGKLLEDLVGMYLYRLFDKKPGHSLNYDAEQGGADFVVGIGNKKIVIEVGVNKTQYKQVVQTTKKVKASYGIVISERTEELKYNEEYDIVKIPLKYFLLT